MTAASAVGKAACFHADSSRLAKLLSLGGTEGVLLLLVVVFNLTDCQTYLRRRQLRGIPQHTNTVIVSQSGSRRYASKAWLDNLSATKSAVAVLMGSEPELSNQA